eukprot:COSAG01_NODE_461_length_16698_cov_113.458160_16_plen_134_part_00
MSECAETITPPNAHGVSLSTPSADGQPHVTRVIIQPRRVLPPPTLAHLPGRRAMGAHHSSNSGSNTWMLASTSLSCASHARSTAWRSGGESQVTRSPALTPSVGTACDTSSTTTAPVAAAAAMSARGAELGAI